MTWDQVEGRRKKLRKVVPKTKFFKPLGCSFPFHINLAIKLNKIKFLTFDIYPISLVETFIEKETSTFTKTLMKRFNSLSVQITNLLFTE
jgi:hypothetical protein